MERHPLSGSTACRATMIVVVSQRIITFLADAMAALEGEDGVVVFGAPKRAKTNGTVSFLLLAPPSLLTARLHRCAEQMSAPLRTVPNTMTEEDRASYLCIARRSQAEAVNGYTVLVLGAQAFLNMRGVLCRSQRLFSRPPPQLRPEEPRASLSSELHQ